jgi:hypothetical protein
MKIAMLDTKRRLVLPGAQPGETYAVWEAEPEHYELTKVIPAPKKSKPSPRTIDALMQSAALTPRLNSEQLRAITRDP